MSANRAPLPSRQTVTAAQTRAVPVEARKRAMVTVVALFIIGLSVILSYDWSNGGFRADAGATIGFAILVAALIFILARSGMAFSGSAAGRARFCAACGRQIPSDAVLCPYCGHRVA